VRVKPTDSGATLYVENTGPVLTAQEVAELRQPFRRGDTRPRSGSPLSGSGSGTVRDSGSTRDSSTVRDSGGSARESTGSAPRSDGFGLGLAIVDAIVAAHDGRWSARPRSSGGLEVRVDLPANLDRLP
jgi:signal transduction histidine kinase